MLTDLVVAPLQNRYHMVCVRKIPMACQKRNDSTSNQDGTRYFSLSACCRQREVVLVRSILIVGEQNPTIPCR